MISAAFEEQFRELQQRFVQRIKGQLDGLLHMLAQLQTENGYAELAAFHALVHQYSGNGRTFGFPLISEAAAPLEMVLHNIKTKSAFLTSLPEINHLSQALIEALKVAIETQAL
jgi:HPt (histidine-containing phosphotransfer) domain-containing protein